MIINKGVKNRIFNSTNIIWIFFSSLAFHFRLYSILAKTTDDPREVAQWTLLNCSTLNNKQTRRTNATVSRFAAKRTSAFRRSHERGKRTGSPARQGIVISDRCKTNEGRPFKVAPDSLRQRRY